MKNKDKPIICTITTIQINKRHDNGHNNFPGMKLFGRFHKLSYLTILPCLIELQSPPALTLYFITQKNAV